MGFLSNNGWAISLGVFIRRNRSESIRDESILDTTVSYLVTVIVSLSSLIRLISRPLPANGYDVWLRSYRHSNRSSRWLRRNTKWYSQPIIGSVPNSSESSDFPTVNLYSLANRRLCFVKYGN